MTQIIHTSSLEQAVWQLVEYAECPKGGWRTPLIEAVDLGRQNTWASRRNVALALRNVDIASSEHQWGDMTLGGSLNLLSLAIDTGSQAMVSRCLVAGCQLEPRGHTIAWRTGNPDIIAMLERTFGALKRPWPDADLEREVMKAEALHQEGVLEANTALAQGKSEGRGRL